MGSLPHWNLETIYPRLDSDEFEQDLKRLDSYVASIRSKLEYTGAQSGAFSDWLLSLLDDYQTAIDITETLYAYVSALLTVDTNDEAAMRGLNRVEEASLAIKAIHVQVINTLATYRSEIATALSSDERIAPYHFVLAELLTEQEHTMSEAEDNLAADLNRSGADAWGRLQEAISSNVDALWDEESSLRKTVIQLRSMAFDADRAVRKRAFEKELEIWRQHEVAFAYAINGVKGTTI